MWQKETNAEERRARQGEKVADAAALQGETKQNRRQTQGSSGVGAKRRVRELGHSPEPFGNRGSPIEGSGEMAAMLCSSH